MLRGHELSTGVANLPVNSALGMAVKGTRPESPQAKENVYSPEI